MEDDIKPLRISAFFLTEARLIICSHWNVLDNYTKTPNRTWQMPTHRPTPGSFLHVATCDLFTDRQQKSHARRVIELPYRS